MVKKTPIKAGCGNLVEKSYFWVPKRSSLIYSLIDILKRLQVRNNIQQQLTECQFSTKFYIVSDHRLKDKEIY